MEKNQVQNANHNDKEFSTGAVPDDQRRGFGSLVFTWIGYVFTVTIMSAGGQLANGASSFGQAMAAVYTGYAVLFFIAMCNSIMAMRSGLSFSLLTRFTFGQYGAKIISLANTVALVCYFSINCYLMGTITNVLFPMIPWQPVCLIFGFLMMFTALKGQKIMNVVGLIATIAVTAVGIVAIVLSFRDAPSKLGESLLTYSQEATTTFTAMVTVAVGSVCSGCCSWAPDIMRFSKGMKTTTSVMAVGLGLAGPFMLVIGICGMLVYKQYDIAYILQEQGFLAFAFIGLVTNIWSTAQGNAYSSSLNLAAVFPKIKREILLIIFAVIGTFMGLIGIYNHFGSFLGILATFYPPLAGTVFANYLFAWRGKTPTFEKVNPKLDAFHWLSLVVYVVGILVAKFSTGFFIPAVNAIIVTFVLEAIVCAVQLRKKADNLRAAIGESL